MKRMLIAVGAAALMFSLGAPPAQADFHLTTQACTVEKGSAHIGLSLVDPATYRYTGDVTCKGATSAELTTLTIRAVTPGATTDGASTDTPVGCVYPCSDTLLADGEAPAGAGIVEVKMTFSAEGPTRAYNNRQRRAQWLYDGSSEPTLICQTPNSASTVACL